MEEQIKIFTGSLIVTNRIASLLDENKISTRIQNNMDSGRLAGFGTLENDIDLYVQNSDFESAQKILMEFNK